MFSIKITIIYFILYTEIAQIQPLVQLPINEDNNLDIAEKIIRNTANDLFFTLKVQSINNNTRIKRFALIHNFFVSITLSDCENLKKIARISAVKDIDNNTQYFIAQINEVLNEDHKSNEAKDDDNNIYVTKYIETFIRKLKTLKKYASYGNGGIKDNILKHVNKDNQLFLNDSDEIFKFDKTINDNSSYEKILDDNEYWQPSGRRIYKGKRTSIRRFPFMASIHFFKKFQCAGSIIQDDLIITSSSCLQIAWNNRFFRENPAFLSVIVGHDYFEFGGEYISVLEIYFYPLYEPKTLKHNLAIIRLSRKIKFQKNHKRVRKIDFDRNPWALTSTSSITVVGWGAKDHTNIIHDAFRNKLSYAKLEFYPLDDCQEHYSKEFVTNRNFCAGFYSKGSGACNRDAGGPGIVDGKLMGVISFGSPICGAADAPTVFTKLGFYTDWIEEIMEQNVMHIKQRTTTLPPSTIYNLHVTHTYTTEKLVITPIVFTKKPRHYVTEADTLRIAEEKSFEDFLSTMFEKEELEVLGSLDSKTEDENKSEVSGSIEIPIDTTYSKDPVRAKPKLITASEYIEDVSDISNKEIEFPTLINITKKTTTKPIKGITVLENVSNDDKTIEDDIMTLIDNLDLGKLLEPVKSIPESSDGGFETKRNESRNKHFVSKEFKEINSDSQEDVKISPSQQSVLNFLFVSAENEDDDDEGLSIPTGPFEDLTFRDTTNSTKNNEVLSEAAMFDLISLAIEEETKRLHKNKRYLI